MRNTGNSQTVVVGSSLVTSIFLILLLFLDTKLKIFLHFIVKQRILVFFIVGHRLLCRNYTCRPSCVDKEQMPNSFCLFQPFQRGIKQKKVIVLSDM